MTSKPSNRLQLHQQPQRWCKHLSMLALLSVLLFLLQASPMSSARQVKVTKALSAEEKVNLIKADPYINYFEHLKNPSINTFEGSSYDFKDASGCDEIGVSPIPSMETWTFLRGVYQAVVGSTFATFPRTEVFGTGYVVDVYVAYYPGMGRAVFSKHPMAEGTKILSSNFEANFTEAWQYRNFLLNLPDVLVCDAITWTYPQKSATAPNGAVLSFTMDDSSMMNTVTNEYDVYGKNTILDKNEKMYYSTRDISSGEQLFDDYGDFVYLPGWDMLESP